MTDILFYKTIVPLNREAHRALHLDTSENRFAFAAGAHLVPAVTDEFALGGHSLPIVFLPGPNGAQPAFLTGLRPGENLFVAADGSWQCDYVPAFIRRYPFMMGEVAGAEPLLCIDEGSTLLGANGDPLFTEAGEDGPVIASASRFLADYKSSADRTSAFASTLARLDLFRSITIDVRLGDGDNRSLHGLLAVDEEKLGALADKEFLALRPSGELTLIYAHLFSLAMVDRLRARAELMKAPSAPAPKARGVRPNASSAGVRNGQSVN